MNTFRIDRFLVLASWGAVALGLPACGEGIERTTQTSTPRSHLQQQVDDVELKSRVNAALTADGHLQAGAITVTVKKGEVTLAGVVPADQITRADEVARRINGVAVVINALRSAVPAS
jgi:hyperosmotically inducible periplasmic protein